jgi:molybdenum cofactor cytidylyltransferase
MKAQTVDIKDSTGRILCCTIFRQGGKKLLAKGHMLSEDDVHLLETEGMCRVWVTELEDGEVGEDQAVMMVASEMGCGALEIRLAAGGRANLLATEDGCVLVDDELLKQINCTASVVIATVPNFGFARAGQRIATVKSAPFAVAQAQLEALLTILRERGPILQARPIRTPSVGVLYTDPLSGERARQLFENIMRQRLERFGVTANYALATVEEESAVLRALEHLLRPTPTAILVASTTAPAGPEDVVGRAIARLGSHMERFLAPVEPGNLLLLAYMDEVPIVSAPGCFRSAKPNVVDLILPPMLARYRVSGWEVA